MNILNIEYSSLHTESKSTLYKKNNKDKRFLSILCNGGLYNFMPDNIQLKRAFSIEDLYKAYSLVYNQYTTKRYIQPNSLGIRIRKFELSNNISTFVVKNRYQVIGVCSLIIDSPEFGLPCDLVYPNETNKIRKNSILLCEATNEALHKEFYSSSALTELLRCVLAQALYKGCDKMLIEVGKNHKRFYKLNYFEQIGTTHNYSEELYDPIILMYSDLIRLIKTFLSTSENNNSVNAYMRKFYYTQNPYMKLVKEWDLYRNLQITNTLKLIEVLQKIYDNTRYCKNLIKSKLLSTAFSRISKEISIYANNQFME